MFPAGSDLGRARQLAVGARPITLGFIDAAASQIAARIAVNARDVGLSVSVTPQAANADVTLIELRIVSTDPAKALAEIAATLGLPIPARDPSSSRASSIGVISSARRPTRAATRWMIWSKCASS